MLESRAVVYGASGVTGRELVRQLIALNYSVTAVVRKRLDDFDSKVTQVVVHNDQYNQGVLMKDADIFIAIGTTQAKTPDAEMYYHIDHDIPVMIASAAQMNQSRSLHVVSAKGADSQSKIRYNRFKGEMERDVQSAFPDAYFYRPSLIIGDRTEKRTGERVAIVLFNALDFLIPKSYKASPTQGIAKKMIHNAIDLPEEHTIESEAFLLK